MQQDHLAESLEEAIRVHTRALNGQYPRPWMTDLANPLHAKVVIVGRNQRNGYPESAISHERHVDALFNRNGESCRRLYEDLVTTPSPTRRNIDSFRKLLTDQGVHEVLETNVICYSSPMSADLARPEHRGGDVKGMQIFRILMHYLRPSVIVAHGQATVRDLSRVLDTPLPSPARKNGPPVSVMVGDMRVFVVQSLAPPQWNKWQGWASEHLEALAKEVRHSLVEKG